MTASTASRASHCSGSYVLHLYCCAPNDVVLGIACNNFAEFAGDDLRDTLSAARSAGWKCRVGGIAAWCPSHAARTFEERCADFAERAACTAPDFEET